MPIHSHVHNSSIAIGVNCYKKPHNLTGILAAVSSIHLSVANMSVGAIPFGH